MKHEKTKLALIGANSMLARMVKHVVPSAFDVTFFDLPDFDIINRDQLISTIKSLKPKVIVNCAAHTNVDVCETSEDLALSVNGAGPGYLADAALETVAILVHISTDYVFAGDKSSPYTENDPTGPISAYGRSKLAGEEAILQSGIERYFILRTSWLYGPGGKNFVETIIRLASEKDELRVVADQVGTPTFTADLATAIFHLLGTASRMPNVEAPFGLYHFSNDGACSWHQFAQEIVSLARENGLPVKTRLIVPVRTEEYPLPARRPAYSVMSKDKYRQRTGEVVPDWRESLKRYFAIRKEI